MFSVISRGPRAHLPVDEFSEGLGRLIVAVEFHEDALGYFQFALRQAQPALPARLPPVQLVGRLQHAEGVNVAAHHALPLLVLLRQDCQRGDVTAHVEHLTTKTHQQKPKIGFWWQP